MNRNLLLVATVLLAACARDGESPSGAPPEPASAAAPAAGEMPSDQSQQAAQALLAPTQGNAVTGSLALSESAEGVRIFGSIQQLAPDGEFGFHVHEQGDCSAADGASAGPHFNPAGQPHGNPTQGEHHAGDIANIRSDAAGVAQVDTTVQGVTLSDVLNRALIVHGGPDDYKTQPSGNSGARVACAVISATTASNLPATQ